MCAPMWKLPPPPGGPSKAQLFIIPPRTPDPNVWVPFAVALVIAAMMAGYLLWTNL